MGLPGLGGSGGGGIGSILSAPLDKLSKLVKSLPDPLSLLTGAGDSATGGQDPSA